MEYQLYGKAFESYYDVVGRGAVVENILKRIIEGVEYGGPNNSTGNSNSP